MIALVSVWSAMFLVTNNGPATLLKELANLVVAEHSTLASVRTGGARPGGRCSKAVLILVGESEGSAVEWYSKD